MTSGTLNGGYREFFPIERKTRVPGGYVGKMLRVNLSTGSTRLENLPEEHILRQLWGGQLLAEYILLHELQVGLGPFDPESVIVGVTGPITGTGFTPGGTKLCFVYLSPATRYTLGRGATSGYLGSALKQADYDGIIITGAAVEPRYIYIGEDRVEVRDARHVWGKGTRDTEDILRSEVGRQDARIGCIGPAGENLVRAAMLVNDYNHNAAHGLGAVMGSKRLKAIVVWGTKRPKVFDKEALIEAGIRWRKALSSRVYTVAKRKTSVGHGEDWGAITKYNWRSTIITDENRGFETNEVILRPCFQCPRLCPWDVKIGEGRHKNKVGHFNAGSEWMDTFYNLGFKGNDVLYLTERINDAAIECGWFADSAGLAFEAWEKGLLGPDDTDGLVLKWGDLEAAEVLLDRCARRQGWLGNLLAEGPKALAQALGGEALNWVVHIKGGTPAHHDWRPLIKNMLNQLVSSGGMYPQGGGSGAGDREPPPDLRYRETWGPLDPGQPNGWARSQLIVEQIRQACGVMGGCWFALNYMAPDSLNSMIDALNATTGWNVTLDEALDVGHRSIILQGIFATQRGWIAEHDWTDVGPRFLEPVPDGKYKGFTIAKWLPEIIKEYYTLSGRHEKTGRPFLDTLRRLNIGEFDDWAQLD